jgi:hypothetical protein
MRQAPRARDREQGRGGLPTRQRKHYAHLARSHAATLSAPISRRSELPAIPWSPPLKGEIWHSAALKFGYWHDDLLTVRNCCCD